jgi:hypothetical protein
MRSLCFEGEGYSEIQVNIAEIIESAWSKLALKG